MRVSLVLLGRRNLIVDVGLVGDRTEVIAFKGYDVLSSEYAISGGFDSFQTR